MALMDQVKKHLREWYSLAADRTGEMAKISVRMYDKYGISREIERQLSELGSYVYHAQAEGRYDFGDDEAFRSSIERIGELEQALSDKVDEIEAIRQQRHQRGAAADESAAGRPQAEDRDDDAAAAGDPPPLLPAETGQPAVRQEARRQDEG